MAAGTTTRVATRLAGTWVNHPDFLPADLGDLTVDVAVGNPRYIRYDDLEDDPAADYPRAWPTMRGRGDIFTSGSLSGL
jgi:hypothetical protein